LFEFWAYTYAFSFSRKRGGIKIIANILVYTSISIGLPP
jgi:hypothetical protein